MSLLSDVVILFSSIAVLTQKGQYLVCASTAFSERYFLTLQFNMWYEMAQLVEALNYKPEGGGLGSRWGYWFFLLTQIFRSQSDPDVESASNRNEKQRCLLEGNGVYCLHTLLFFSSKCCLFDNSTFFGSCIIHILHTGCAKI
jgi:hypothetical protein